MKPVIQADCVELMGEMPPGSIPLAFADPPFNIGYDYDAYDDDRPAEDYLAWTGRWLAGVDRVTADDGTIWIAIGDEYAAEMVVAAKSLGWTMRNWVIQYITFGVATVKKFARTHIHLCYFVKDAKRFTFRPDEIRVASARQTTYGDKRAAKGGKLPDDVWILRPDAVPGMMAWDQDTWLASRVAGTFKERVGGHGCQMPEAILARIIRACTKPGEKVFDPFCGTGTTAAVAKKLGRQAFTCDVSAEYVRLAEERLSRIRPGDTIFGE